MNLLTAVMDPYKIKVTTLFISLCSENEKMVIKGPSWPNRKKCRC